jgi:hypothetical protein
MAIWFHRLAEVPHLNYQTPHEADGARLPGHGAISETAIYEYDSKRRTSMMWLSLDGSSTTSASPARQWETQPRPHETPGQTTLRQLQEQLELSGTVEDYVFCIQTAIISLWDRHRDEPWVYMDVERLCLLVIRMVETYPDAVAQQLPEGRSFYYGSWAYTQLITLYEREGYLHEALDIGTRGLSFGVSDERVEALRQRVAQLEDEDDK